ncbi:MAG: hypothetical protein M3Q97_08635 [Bacteroidota bacterium]|nr:hypothetical protein [Bacteroidota bacterium]
MKRIIFFLALNALVLLGLNLLTSCNKTEEEDKDITAAENYSSCDNQGTVVVNGQTYSFTMK